MCKTGTTGAKLWASFSPDAINAVARSPFRAHSVNLQALAERRSRETSEQASQRVRGAQQLEERVRREAGKEVSTLREGSSRLEAEVGRLRLEGERAAAAAQQEVQRLRCV